MPFITVELLRRRSEHNEGCLSTLKEIALHQQDIERLSVIGDVCRELEIIYLCNNYIPRIENLLHLKHLKYLNLAINNIKVIEGLEGCEMLEKLDLTLNFIAEFESVRRLRANAFLKNLHLTGNPCCDVAGYRLFVIEQLPQLKELDGTHIDRSEAIVARQDRNEVAETAHRETVRAREAQRLQDEMRARGIDPFPAKHNDAGERVYGHSAEERMQMLQEQQAEEARRKEAAKPAPGSISAIQAELNAKPVVLTPAQEIEKYGRVMMRNEAKLPFTMVEDKLDEALFGGKSSNSNELEREGVIITCEPGRFISTALIELDVQTTYVRITIKGKVLQLVLPVEVAADRVKVQRSQTTGQLKLQIPVAKHIAQERLARKNRFKLSEEQIDD